MQEILANIVKLILLARQLKTLTLPLERRNCKILLHNSAMPSIIALWAIIHILRF